jgi:chemotaxis signal transduction protein
VASPEFHAGKYLTFRVARQDFAIHVSHVKAVLPVREMAEARCARGLLGCILWRSAIVPVTDLRRKLHLTAAPGRERYVMVVDASTPRAPRLAAFVADRITDVVAAREKDYRRGKLRIGRPRRVLSPEEVSL